jgi:hypothetical protein
VRRALAAAAVAALALSALLVAGQPSAEAHRGGRPLQDVRHATAPFRDFAVAQAAGTVPVVDVNGLTCIEDPEGSGAMGTHYLFPDRLMSGSGFDGQIVATSPEILLYDATKASPELLGVEYVVVADAWHAAHGKQPPKLFGRKFELVAAGNRFGLPAFYELHVWLWKHNPNGLFADFNPRVPC